MTFTKGIQIPALLCVLVFSGTESALAAGNEDWSEQQHVYIEDCGKYKNGRESRECRPVFYSLAHDDRIALKLKSPHKAASIPEMVEDEKKLAGLAAACSVGKDELLQYKTLNKDNLSVASYEVKGCKEPAQLLWLATKIAKELNGDVALGGLIVRKANDSTLYLYLDEVVARIGQPITIPLSGTDGKLLELAQLELVGPDPFDPKRRFLLRTQNTNELSFDRVPTAEQLAQARDPMLRTDFLACAARGGGGTDTPALSPAWCQSRRELFISLRRSENVGNQASQPDYEAKFEAASQDFHARQPISIIPTLIPISTKGPQAGFDAWLKSQKTMEDKFSGSVTVNSISNQSDERDNSTLSVAFKGNQGSYPGKLRLKVGAQVRFGGGSVDENVTQLLASYDRYFKPWVEAYGFVERFTDDFMNIEQRWEGGVGMLFEYDARRGSKDSFCYDAGYGYFGKGKEIRVTKKTRQRLDEYQDRVRQQLFRQGFIDADLQQDYCKYKRGIEKRNATFQLGLAVSVFSDFEEPDTLTVRAREDEDDENPATLKLTPPSTEIIRYTLRPTITIRPHDRVTLEGWYYLKTALNPDDEDDLLYGAADDVRREWTLNANLRLNDGNPKVSLTTSVTQYEDDRPPRLSAIDVFNQAVAGLTFVGETPMAMDTSFPGSLTGSDDIEPRAMVTVDGFVAQRRHTVFTGGLTIGF